MKIALAVLGAIILIIAVMIIAFIFFVPKVMM